MVFSADETLDIGSDSGTPVSDDLPVDELEFNGKVGWIELDLGDDAEDPDHLITAEERLQVAMARQ
jgi:arylsulfatase